MTAAQRIADDGAADAAARAASASTEIPRFEDGTTSLQEVSGVLAEGVTDEVMDAEAEQLCAATGNSRNGHRERRLVTCVGTIMPRIPKPGAGSFFPDAAVAAIGCARPAGGTCRAWTRRTPSPTAPGRAS